MWVFCCGTIFAMAKTSFGKKHIPLIIGNWKMNPQTEDKAQILFGEIKKAVISKKPVAEVVVCTPSVFIGSVQKLSKKGRIKLGAQDVFYADSGAHTGEVSLSMLKSLGVLYVIVGHSERRACGETDLVVQKKVSAVLQSGLSCIVCVGETTRDAHGDYFNVVETQLKSFLSQLKTAHLSRLIIAYEPIWAIGTSKHATAEDVQEMKLFIQKIIAHVMERSAVAKVRILYGGSVNKDNAEELLIRGQTDGFLVGGASLKAKDFGEIIHISDFYGS